MAVVEEKILGSDSLQVHLSGDSSSSPGLMGNKHSRRRAGARAKAAAGPFSKSSSGSASAASTSTSGSSSGSSGGSGSDSGSADVKVKHYIVEDFLGEGGYSKVFRGRDSESGEPVALKLLKTKKKAIKKDKFEAVQKEVEAMTKAAHPNVLRLIDVDWECEMPTEDLRSTQIAPLMVLELAEGGDFFEFLVVTGGFEEKLARTYFKQLISGIKACHKAGVVHRDLKPENLLLDRNFTLKIADFGLASVRSGSGDHVMKTLVGSKAYMAPEVIAGRTYTASADIFSSGVLVFLMIAGFPPFMYASESDWWFEKISSGKHDEFWLQHSSRKTFSYEARNLIEGMLDADADTRWTLEDIEKDPWFNGEVFDAEELAKVMLLKKKTILKKKMKQMAKAPPKKAPRVDDDIDRSMPSDSPYMIPSFPRKEATGEESGTFEMVFSPSEAPVFDEKESVTFTKFECKVSPEYIAKALKQTLSDLDCRSNFDASNWAFEANYFLKETGEKMVFEILLYKNGLGCVVELRRITGSVVLFGMIFNDIMGDLAEVLDVSD